MQAYTINRTAHQVLSIQYTYIHTGMWFARGFDKSGRTFCVRAHSTSCWGSCGQLQRHRIEGCGLHDVHEGEQRGLFARAGDVPSLIAPGAPPSGCVLTMTRGFTLRRCVAQQVQERACSRLASGNFANLQHCGCNSTSRKCLRHITRQLQLKVALPVHHSLLGRRPKACYSVSAGSTVVK